MPRPTATRSLVGQSAIFYTSIYVFATFKFVGGFLVAQILGPSLYGLRSVFGLVTEYEFFTHLGTYDALQREVPFHRARDESSTAQKLLDSAFSINMVYCSVVAAISLAIAVWLARSGAEPIYPEFFVFLAAWVFLGKVSEFFRASLITEKQTGVLSMVNTVHGFFTAAGGVALTWWFGLRGLFAGLLLAEAVRAGWYATHARAMPRLTLERAVLGRLYRVGLPITAITLIFVLLRSVDRVVIASLLSQEMLGYFAIGTIVSGLIYLSVGDLSRTILFPRLMERLGRSVDLAEARFFLEQPMVLVAYLVPYAIAWGYLLIPVPIRYFLPEYLPAIEVSQLLLLGSFFFSTVSVPLLVCVGLNQQIRLVFLGAGAVALNAGLSVALIRGGWGIEGVAVGTAITYFLFGVVVLTFAQIRLGTGWGRQTRFFLLVNVPFPLMTLLLVGLEQLGRPWEGTLVVDSLTAVLRASLFSVAFALTLIPLRKHEGFVRLIAGLPIPRRRPPRDG